MSEKCRGCGGEYGCADDCLYQRAVLAEDARDALIRSLGRSSLREERLRALIRELLDPMGDGPMCDCGYERIGRLSTEHMSVMRVRCTGSCLRARLEAALEEDG